MAAASHRDLDPRQVKAREEFERMREQLTRSLERPVDPTPWRERARERVAAFERETQRRRPPLAVAARNVRWPRWAPLAAAFALGVAVTGLLAAAAVVLLRSPEPQSAQNAVLVSDPVAIRDVPAQETPAVIAAPTTALPVEVALAVPVAAEPEPTPVEPAAAAVTPVAEIVTLTALIEPAAVAEPEPEVEAALPPPVAPASAPRPDPVVEQIARVREIQTLLIEQGHALGRPDGDAGPQTLTAAADFATTHGLADANLDEAFLAALREAQAGYLVPVAPLAQRDPMLEEINRVRSAQAALNELGYDLGRPDGDAGPQTLAAIDEFAASRSLADVNLDPALVALLQDAADAR